MFADKTIKDFINELKSEAPTPGGGGVASLNAANGVALIMMVANLTLPANQHEDWVNLCNTTVRKAQELLDIFLEGIDADAAEFSKVVAAYSLPHDNDEQKMARTIAIGKASISASEAPLKVMEACVHALELDRALLGRSNPNLVSDLYVAALSLQSALVAAKFNVDANLYAVNKIDPARRKQMEERADELVGIGCELAEEILKASIK